jgi:hypothetical protein
LRFIRQVLSLSLILSLAWVTEATTFEKIRYNFINENFAGQTPAKLRLSPRLLRIRLFLQGYKEWAQEIEVFEGSEVNLQIELQK